MKRASDYEQIAAEAELRASQPKITLSREQIIAHARTSRAAHLARRDRALVERAEQIEKESRKVKSGEPLDRLSASQSGVEPCTGGSPRPIPQRLVADLKGSICFLNFLHQKGRVTIAALEETPFGSRWLQGITFEADQYNALTEHLQKLSAALANVYYGVNGARPPNEQTGAYGKANSSDITSVRAIVCDIDLEAASGRGEARARCEAEILATLQSQLVGGLIPSFIVFTGGGFQVVWVLQSPIDITISRTKVEASDNVPRDSMSRALRDKVEALSRDLVAHLRNVILADFTRPDLTTPDDRFRFRRAKVDSLNNVDRVMRLPGTVNYPSRAKRDKGQIEQLAKIVFSSNARVDFDTLRLAVPETSRLPARASVRQATRRFRPNKKFPEFAKAKWLCEQIRDHDLASDNEDYSINLMLPLLGMVNEGAISESECVELFLLAMSRSRTPANGSWLKTINQRLKTRHNYWQKNLGSLVHFWRERLGKTKADLPWSREGMARTETEELKRLVAAIQAHVDTTVYDENELFGR